VTPGRDPLAALADPDQWSWAAPALASTAAHSDKAALAALISAYGRRTERSRTPLLDAMESLGGVAAVAALGGSADVADRRLAARLAHLLPDAAHVSVLERLVSDPDRDTAAEARAALRTQPRDRRWRELVRALAESGDPELRAEAQAWEREGQRR
jgi:hypothetical protein